jgi:hypothetical protein
MLRTIFQHFVVPFLVLEAIFCATFFVIYEVRPILSAKDSEDLSGFVGHPYDYFSITVIAAIVISVPGLIRAFVEK